MLRGKQFKGSCYALVFVKGKVSRLRGDFFIEAVQIDGSYTISIFKDVSSQNRRGPWVKEGFRAWLPEVPVFGRLGGPGRGR